MREGAMMRGLDCKDPSHGDLHINAADDDELEHKVEQHIRESHPDMSPDQARSIVAEGAYDE